MGRIALWVAAIALPSLPPMPVIASQPNDCLQAIARQQSNLMTSQTKLLDAHRIYSELPEDSIMLVFVLSLDEYPNVEKTAQTGDDILANCPTVEAITFAPTGRSGGRTYGVVNGQAQWFQCVRSSPLSWGQRPWNSTGCGL